MRVKARSVMKVHFVLACVTLPLAPGAHAQPLAPARTIAINAQPAPGTGAGVNYAFFTFQSPFDNSNVPVINGFQEALFRSDLAGPGTNFASNLGLFGGTITSPNLLARRGAQASGAPAGVLWQDFLVPRLNDNGTLALTALLTGEGVDGTNNKGLWRGPLFAPAPGTGPGTPALLVRRGQSAGIATLPGALIADIFSETVRLNDVDDVAFAAALSGPGITSANDSALLRVRANGQRDVIAIENDQAPGQPAGVVFANFADPSGLDVSSLVMGDARAAWISLLRGAGVTSANDRAAFSLNLATGEVITLMREGASAGAIRAGSLWGEPGSISVGNNGSVAVRSTINAPPGGALAVITRWVGGVPSIVALSSDPAPGLTDVLVSDLLATPNLAPKINADGAVAYVASLAGSSVSTANNQMIYFQLEGGTSQPVLRKGAQVPGAPAGTVIGAFNSFTLNALGDIVVQCTLAGPGVSADNNDALVACVFGFPPRMFAREGATVNVSPTETRTINVNGITLTPQSAALRNNSGGSDGQRTSLGSDGVYTYRAWFTDGTSRLLAVDVGSFACGESDVAGAGQTIGPDGDLTADDIVVFINWFFSSDARADVAGQGQTETPDGQFTADDLIVFINRFFAGC